MIPCATVFTVGASRCALAPKRVPSAACRRIGLGPLHAHAMRGPAGFGPSEETTRRRSPGSSSVGKAAVQDETITKAAVPGEGADEEKGSEQWERVSDTRFAGGRLHVVRLSGERMIRVWLPPGYIKSLSQGGHPTLFLHDGQNVFGDCETLSGHSWRAAETAAWLISEHKLPPFVIVGVDHSGETRSFDYNPVKPGTGEDNIRADAKDWAGGGVNDYIELFMETIVPWATREYNCSTRPELRVLGGSSFGGICTLCLAMQHPEAFGSILVESPSLWIDKGQFLRKTIKEYKGKWPQKVFTAMGGKECSGLRGESELKFDEYLVKYAKEFAATLQAQGLGQDRLLSQVDPEASHNEAAWSQRLPAALSFLCGGWWKAAADLHNESGVFTLPWRPAEGKPCTLFFNKSAHAALQGSKDVKVTVGFNNWGLGKTVMEMEPTETLSAVTKNDWFTVKLKVPDDAYDMQFVFSDGSESVWVNSNGENFWKAVDARLRRRAADEKDEEGEQEDLEDAVQSTAHKHSTKLWFTWPTSLVAGEPAKLYLNRYQSQHLRMHETQQVHYGFDGWQNVQVAHLDTTAMWRDVCQDWWVADIDVPEGFSAINFSFTNGYGAWENNNGQDFWAPIKTKTQAREDEKEEVNPHASGLLHVLTLAKPKGLDAKALRAARWTTEKTVRVWTPENYSAENAPPGGWPVIIFNDGQNKFEDWLAHDGTSWRAGEAASNLITSGKLPPFVVVGIDNSGPMRSLNYLPYPPGAGVGGFRQEAERWPGGGVDKYMDRIVNDILPLLTKRFALATHPSRVAFAGGSFGGVCALYSALKYPQVFGCVIAESPSLWVAEGRFVQDLDEHQGHLPERLFMGCGTREYSATRDHAKPEVDQLLLHYYQEAERILRSKGMNQTRFRFVVEEGAGHHEKAWQWRLPGAMEFILKHWWLPY